jgi:hypothetical protein
MIVFIIRSFYVNYSSFQCGTGVLHTKYKHTLIMEMGHISCTKTKDANNSNFMKHGKRSDDIEVENRKDICKIIKIYQKV